MKLLTVVGATGNQGRSVIDAVLADPSLTSEFKIRGITRDATKPAAQELANKGVEIVCADLSDRASLIGAFKDTHTAFFTNFWESLNPDIERTQGFNVAETVKELDVKHLIFSSLINISEGSHGKLTRVKHYDIKAEIEEHIRKLKIPATFVLPGYYMSNLVSPISTFRKNQYGVYEFRLPLGLKAKIPLLDINSDYGKFVKAAIKHRESLIGKQLYAGVKYYTPQEIVDDFTAVTFMQATVTELPLDIWKSVFPPEMSEELLQTHLLLGDPGYFGGASLDSSLALIKEDGDTLHTWKDFVSAQEWK